MNLVTKPRVFNVKRGCTYKGIPINSILFSFPFNGSWIIFHDFFFFNILKLKLKFSAQFSQRTCFQSLFRVCHLLFNIIQYGKYMFLGLIAFRLK